MRTTANCLGEDAFTDDSLPTAYLVALANAYCPTCPLIAPCLAGIDGDLHWVIRGGQVNAKYFACQAVDCTNPVLYKGKGRHSLLCTDHRGYRKHRRTA